METEEGKKLNKGLEDYFVRHNLIYAGSTVANLVSLIGLIVYRGDIIKNFQDIAELDKNEAGYAWFAGSIGFMLSSGFLTIYASKKNRENFIKNYLT